MAKKRCHRCGCARFEKVDITSAKDSHARYFIRCGKCGLVTVVSECAVTKPANVATLLDPLFKGSRHVS